MDLHYIAIHLLLLCAKLSTAAPIQNQPIKLEISSDDNAHIFDEIADFDADLVVREKSIKMHCIATYRTLASNQDEAIHAVKLQFGGPFEGAANLTNLCSLVLKIYLDLAEDGCWAQGHFTAILLDNEIEITEEGGVNIVLLPICGSAESGSNLAWLRGVPGPQSKSIATATTASSTPSTSSRATTTSTSTVNPASIQSTSTSSQSTSTSISTSSTSTSTSSSTSTTSTSTSTSSTKSTSTQFASTSTTSTFNLAVNATLAGNVSDFNGGNESDVGKCEKGHGRKVLNNDGIYRGTSDLLGDGSFVTSARGQALIVAVFIMLSIIVSLIYKRPCSWAKTLQVAEPPRSSRFTRHRKRYEIGPASKSDSFNQNTTDSMMTDCDDVVTLSDVSSLKTEAKTIIL